MSHAVWVVLIPLELARALSHDVSLLRKHTVWIVLIPLELARVLSHDVFLLRRHAVWIVSGEHVWRLFVYNLVHVVSIAGLEPFLSAFESHNCAGGRCQLKLSREAAVRLGRYVQRGGFVLQSC